MKKKDLILISLSSLFFLVILTALFAIHSSRSASLEAKAVDVFEPTGTLLSEPPEAFSPPPFVYFEQPGIMLKTIEESDDNIKITLNYPETESLSVNESIKRIILEHVGIFKENNKTGSLDIMFTPYRYNDYIIGFVFDIYEYNPETGLNFSKRTVTYDLMGGISLNLSDLFTDQYDYLSVISKQTRKQLFDTVYIFNDSNENKLKAEIQTSTLPAEINFNQFVFDKDNLYFYFKMDNASDGAYLEAVLPLSTFADGFNMEHYFMQYFGIRENDFAMYQDGEQAPHITKTAPQTDDSGAQIKYIALTFDDGPSSNTPRLLDGLAEYDVKATFFLLGHRLEAKSDIVKRIFDEGHSIGNHSFNHKELTKLTLEAINYQIDETNELIFGITGQETILLRPPYGSKSSKVIDIAKSKNMSIINWNVDPQDWKNKSAEDIARHIIGKAKDGDIILLHDIYSKSVDATLIVVDELTKAGFKFVTVDELIEIKQGKAEAGFVYTSGMGKSEK